MIVVERDIDAPPAAVWAPLSELDRWHEFLPTVDDVVRLGEPGPVSVGMRFRVAQPGLATAAYAVTDWRPGTGFTWVARSTGVRTTASHELHPTATGSRLKLGIDWSGPGAWLARALFTGKARHFMEQEAAAFAELAERRQH